MFNNAIKSKIDKRFKSVCIRKLLIIFKCSDSNLGFLIVLKPGKGNIYCICQYALNSRINDKLIFHFVRNKQNSA